MRRQVRLILNQHQPSRIDNPDFLVSYRSGPVYVPIKGEGWEGLECGVITAAYFLVHHWCTIRAIAQFISGDAVYFMTCIAVCFLGVSTCGTDKATFLV